MSNKILNTLNIGNNSYEIDDAFARQKIEEVDNNLSKINPVYSTSGSVVSFDDGADNLPLEELIVDINPVQDLHGYDSPWPAGGGKNLFENKFVTSTKNGITATVDEDGVVTLNGTSTGTGYVIFDITTGTITLPSNDSYIVSGGADGGGANTYRLYFEYYNYTNETWNGLTCTSADAERLITTDKIRNVKIQVFNNVTCDNVVFKPMIRKATETDATFAPYSNICPITGRTEAIVWRTGKNMCEFSNTTNKNRDRYSYQKEEAADIEVIKERSGGSFFARFVMHMKEGHEYTFSMSKMTRNGMSVEVPVYVYSDELWGERVVVLSLSESTKNAKYTATTTGDVVIGVYDSNAPIGTEIVLKKFMVCLSTAPNPTTYEPYLGSTYPVSWQSEAGTVYGGTLDVLTGMLTVDKAMITADELYSYGSGNLTYGRVVLPNALPTASVSTDYVTSKFPVDKSAAENTTRRVSGYAYFYFPAGTTREYAESVVNGTQIVYPVADPITYQLTPHEAKTLLGQNNIFTDINSNNILVTYKASVQKCIDRATTSIPYGQVDATSTSTNFTATIDGITELRDGVCVILRNGVVTSASGFTININNLGAKPVYSSMAASTRETTIFNSAYTVMLIYSTSLNDGDGGWWFYRGYNSDTNTTGYVLRTNSMALPLSSHTHCYRLLFTSADGTHFVPANNDTTDNTTAIKNVCQEKIDPFGTIRYYNGSATLEAEEVPSGSTIWEQNTFSLGYSFNRVGGAINLAIRKPVYIKALPQSDGSAIIDADEPYVQDLPTTEDGFIYIYLGSTYSASDMELTSYHPVYYYHNGAVQLWTGPESFTDDYKNKIDTLWADYQSRIGQ